MKPGTGLSLLIPLLLTSILGAGCIMPGAPDDDHPEPDPDTPLNVLWAFGWCYDYLHEGHYAELLDPDFTYILDRDHGGMEEHLEWGREEELSWFADLCDACDKEDIRLYLDVDDYESPGPEDDEWLIPNVAYDLLVNLEDITLVCGRADFLTVKVEEEGRWRLLELRGFERPEPPF